MTSRSELDQTHSGSSSNDDCNFPLTGVNEGFTPVPEAQTWDFDIFEYASTHPEDFMTRITGFALDHLGSIKLLRLDHKVQKSRRWLRISFLHYSFFHHSSQISSAPTLRMFPTTTLFTPRTSFRRCFSHWLAGRKVIAFKIFSQLMSRLLCF